MGRPERCISYINTWSVVNKTALIHSAINKERLDVLGITKTSMRVDHAMTINSDSVLASISILHVHRPRDRTGGGVAVILQESLRAWSFYLAGKFTSFEVDTTQLSVGTGRLNLLTIYHRPRQSSRFFAEFHDLLDEIVTLSGGHIICGSQDCTSKTGIIDQQMQQIIDDYDLCQHINEHTHSEGHTPSRYHFTAEPKISSISIADLSFSDHSMVIASTDISRPLPACQTFEAWNFKTLDNMDKLN